MKGFRPGIVPSLVVAVLVPVMVCLGFWQLSRGEQKRVLMENYAERRVAPPMDSTELAHTPDPAFRPVTLQGQFDVEHSILLDNRQHDGKVGVELLQPFLDHRTGLWLLVNRGWLPWPDRRIPPVFDTPEQPVNLQAWVYVAPGAAFQLHADPAGAPWPRLVTAIEPDKLWSELDRNGFAYELRQQSGPGAYRTDWPVVSMGPEKHLAYAVQWFAMAAALLGLFLYFGWHNAGRHHGNHHESNQHV